MQIHDNQQMNLIAPSNNSNQQQSVQLLPFSKLPKSDVLEDVFDFFKPEYNLLDQIDLYYLVPETSESTHSNDLFEEIPFPPEGIVKLEQGSLVKQENGRIQQ